MVAAYRPLIQHARAILVGIAMPTRRISCWNDSTGGITLKRERGRPAVRRHHLPIGPLAQLKEVERLSFRLDSRVNHLLLDEFADTALAH